MSLRPRAVIVHRRSEFDELLAHHGTAQQAEFFVRQRDRSIEEVEDRHQRLQMALTEVRAAIPLDWRRAEVERSDLARFVFGPEDIVVVVGQDGLVANIAKYLDEQPVLGVDPEPGYNAGVLVTHDASDVAELLAAVVNKTVLFESRTLVEATTDDGQVLRAANELFIGRRTHQSSLYRITCAQGQQERQSSSGLLIGTGTGATGWLRSVSLERGSSMAMPTPTERTLAWFVREAWPSPTTGASLTEGRVEEGETLAVVAESDLVCFGDGVESDHLRLSWGQRITITQSENKLQLARSLGVTD